MAAIGSYFADSFIEVETIYWVTYMLIRIGIRAFNGDQEPITMEGYLPTEEIVPPAEEDEPVAPTDPDPADPTDPDPADPDQPPIVQQTSMQDVLD